MRPYSLYSISEHMILFNELIFFIYGATQKLVDASNSVPMPIYMDEMLTAGRLVYDKQATPTMRDGVATTVNLSMYIEGIGSFQAQTMDFQLDVYLQQFWKDTRLAHNESKRILLRDKTILNRIWHPDVYFANARIAQFHEVTQPNFLFWIEPDGTILYDTRVSMIVICAMQLQNYPLDSQWCHLRILSYAYDVEQLTISWIPKDPITRNPNITLSDMHIVKLVPGLCDGNYSTGSWSCVTAEFFVTREITHHILQTYVPTTLIVIISWFSFWLDVELLTLSTQANSVRNSLPEVSYMKSLDLFLAISVLFVFGVLIEFTIVNYTQRNATIAAAGDKVPDDKNTESMCDRFRLLLSRFCRNGSDFKNLIEGYNVAAAGSQEDPNNNNTANCSIPSVPPKSVEPSANTAKLNDYSVHQMDYGHTAIDLDMPLEETMTFNNSASPSSISWNESVSNGRVQNNNNNTGSNVRPRLFTAISQKKIAAKGDSTNSPLHYPNTFASDTGFHNKDCAEWRDRGAERLANWTKTELSSDELAETLQSTPNYNHWPKLNLSLPPIAKSEESDLNESTSPRFSSKLALRFKKIANELQSEEDLEKSPPEKTSSTRGSAKWRMAIRQIQKIKEKQEESRPRK